MSTDDYILGTGSGSLVSGYKPSDVENPDLTWEKTSMFNVGADLSVLGGYLNLTAEYYYANTTDMLLEVPIPHLTGYSTTLMNIGKVNNRGWELSASSQHSFANGISYSLNANWATNTNEVKTRRSSNRAASTTPTTSPRSANPSAPTTCSCRTVSSATRRI